MSENIKNQVIPEDSKVREILNEFLYNFRLKDDNESVMKIQLLFISIEKDILDAELKVYKKCEEKLKEVLGKYE
jgi:5'(3')-deoxyribonucleotidase